VQRENERKARSLSSVAAFFLGVLLLFLPACFFMGMIIIFADSFAMAATLMGLVVNRLGKTRAAGLIIVFAQRLR